MGDADPAPDSYPENARYALTVAWNMVNIAIMHIDMDGQDTINEQQARENLLAAQRKIEQAQKRILADGIDVGTQPD